MRGGREDIREDIRNIKEYILYKDIKEDIREDESTVGQREGDIQVWGSNWSLWVHLL